MKIDNKIIFFILILLWVLFEIIWDYLFKRRSIENKNIILIIWFVIYCIWWMFRALSLKYEILSKSIIIFTILNLIIWVLIWIIIFGEWESLSMINKIWIILGIISVILLEIDI